MPAIPQDPVKKAVTSLVELKSLEQNLQHALDDAIARGVITTPLNAVISRLIAHLRARQQVVAL